MSISYTTIKGPQEGVDKAIIDHIAVNPSSRGEMQAQILKMDHANGRDVTQNAIASQKALEQYGNKMTEQVREELQNAINMVLNKSTN